MNEENTLRSIVKYMRIIGFVLLALSIYSGFLGTMSAISSSIWGQSNRASLGSNLIVLVPVIFIMLTPVFILIGSKLIESRKKSGFWFTIAVFIISTLIIVFSAFNAFKHGNYITLIDPVSIISILFYYIIGKKILSIKPVFVN